MSKTPFMPLYFGDFLAATAFWSGEEQGLYLLLLGYQWSNGPLPTNPIKLAKAVRYDEQRFIDLWNVISAKFEHTDEGLVNSRLEAHRRRAFEISEKRALAGAQKGKAKRSSKQPKQTGSKNKAIASGLLKQTPSNGDANAKQVQVICTPSNPNQTILRTEDEEAHEGGNLQ
jgi:uncharacterized protein YdaU (DUF1376 family)